MSVSARRRLMRSVDKAIGILRTGDHWIVEKRYVMGWTLYEGAGTDGGRWMVKGRGETKIYDNRQDAEMHIEMSMDN